MADEPSKENTISASKNASWFFAEHYIAEDDVLDAARDRADDYGCVPISAGTGAVLRALATSLQARAIVEIGTGTGVSSVWLLRGMPVDGVLTTIDVDAETQRAARETFADAGFQNRRVRVIAGRAREVLPRLSDGAYDMVLVDADRLGMIDYLNHALRLLRPGGIVAFAGALNDDLVPNPAQRDEDTVACRQLLAAIRDDDRVVPTLLPVGDGLLVTVCCKN